MTGLLRVSISATGLALLFIFVALVVGDRDTAAWMGFAGVGLSIFALAVWLFEVYKPLHKSKHRLKDEE